MKQSLFSLFTITLLMFLFSCSDTIEKKLIGTWEVSDVQTEFNETEVTPQMLSQVVEMQKQTYFRFVNDSTMVIISSNNTHEAKWSISEDDNTITYFFSGMGTIANKLGKFNGDQIVNETNTPLGTMTIFYEKK